MASLPNEIKVIVDTSELQVLVDRVKELEHKLAVLENRFEAHGHVDGSVWDGS